MVYATVVGRLREDLEKIEIEASGYIGKHLVGTGEDMRLTTKVYFDFLKPHVVLCCGKRGSGKCVTGDTLVYLNDGRLLPIKEIVEKRKKIALVSLNQHTASLEESKAVDFFEREVRKIVKIKLWNGLEVKVTENHPFLTPFGWKEAKELKVGDYVAVPSRIEVKGKDCLRDFEIKLLAYLIAEGVSGKSFVWFSNKDKKLVKDFIRSVKEFDNSLKIIKSGETTYRVVGTRGRVEMCDIKFSSKGFSKGTKVVVRRNSLLKWLEDLGLRGKKAGEKFIPSMIFQLSKKKLSLFLRYLFSCDGSFYKKKSKRGYVYVIEYSSKSKELILQLYHLLLRFGIVSYIRKKEVKGKTYYRLLVTNFEDVKKFVLQIGFLGKEKLIKEILLKRKTYHSNFKLLPLEIWEYIRNKYRKKDIAKALGYKNPKGVSVKYKYNPLISTIRKIANFFDDPYLKRISSPDIIWMRIVEIENKPTKVKVYDITVNEHHNFIGNGIILHNSYSAAVILEEFCLLKEKYRNKLAFVVVDPMGIYWSMKYPNEQQAVLLKSWNLEPRGFKDLVEVYVPKKQREEYEEAGIPIDGTISLALKEFSAEDLILALDLERTGELAIALEKNFNLLLETGKPFGFDDLIDKIREDMETRKEVKDALVNMLEVVSSWGLIGKEGIKVEEMVKRGKVVIIDLSRMRSDVLRSLLVALLARKIYRARVLARKEEERVKIEGGEVKFSFPLTWFVLEEAHNFIPSEKDVVSSDPIKRLAKEGREPGIGLFVITQMPNKIHQDILSQCDIVISHRLTSKADLDALHVVMQTYMREEIWKYLSRLPRMPGAAIILDDNLEKIFTVQMRPRLSWHAGGTAAIL